MPVGKVFLGVSLEKTMPENPHMGIGLRLIDRNVNTLSERPGFPRSSIDLLVKAERQVPLPTGQFQAKGLFQFSGIHA